MKGDARKEFLDKLSEHYGEWSKATARFGITPYGKIAQALNISPSQFSKLISGTATEGMYTRTTANINRLMYRDSLLDERDQAVADQETKKAELSRLRAREGRSRLRYTVVGLATGICLTALAFVLGRAREVTTLYSSPHPLSSYFDRGYDEQFFRPYLALSEVQNYCPCSAYEGVWELSEQYKLPLPGNRKPGVYYVAKRADVRMKCSRYDTFPPGKGRVLMGYEQLVNEIWVDTERQPLSPTYFDKDIKQFTSAFTDLSLEGNSRFKKVATINSFFVDRFEIYPDSIVRKGEPYGRYASELDQKLADTYEIDINYILNDVLGDLTTTSCTAFDNRYCDPNTLTEGESVIAFDCQYTIASENLGIGGGYPYTKGYRLKKQAYAANLTCECSKLAQ